MFKGIFNFFMKAVDACALVLVVQSVNSACMWHFHQPEIPKEALVYKKVNKC